ncbi:MAG: XRE family transcriptional regulator [Methanobacteriaceae archaeon]|nr:XRE family transcriptional regulator [Methanobacteriaceae archaeon]
MVDTRKEIASRVQDIRELSDISVEEIASKLCISTDTYNDYENAVVDIPASILFEAAQIFNVDTNLLLTGEESRMNIFTITRKNKGVKVDRREQYNYENLASNFIHKRLEPFVVTVNPRLDGTKPDTNAHKGQEFVYVLDGRLKVYIHENEIELDPEDSMYFDSRYDHAMEALDGKPTKFLSIIL